MGLCLEKDQVKPLETLDGALMEYHGWAVVRISYQGQQNQTRLLVTPKLRNEVIFSKVVLRGLVNRGLPKRHYQREKATHKSPLTRGANRKSPLKNGANHKNERGELQESGNERVNCKSLCIMS